MPTPRKDPKIGSLVMVTYGLVAITTALAIGGYYYLSSHMQDAGVSQDQAGQDRLVQVGAVWVAQYPGARLAPANVTRQEIPDGELTEGEMAFRTADDPEKVLTYYRDKLGFSHRTKPAEASRPCAWAEGRASKSWWMPKTSPTAA